VQIDLPKGHYVITLTGDNFETQTKQITMECRGQAVAFDARTPIQKGLFKNRWSMKFKKIEPGMFYMGSDPAEDKEALPDESGRHKVVMTKAFFMQTTEVTQAQWEVVMKDRPSRFKGDDLPVERVSWQKVQEYIEKLNSQEVEGKYRLPTEEEWEYAARAGSTGRYCFGSSTDELSQYAWYKKNSGGSTQPVGSKNPNDFGMYDMHGNVWEWVQDLFALYKEAGDIKGYSGPELEKMRVLRGGGWADPARYLRSAQRSFTDPNNAYDTCGFRLVFDPKEEP
jgi:formylglycine-generating enzyme required for sulfatase activity